MYFMPNQLLNDNYINIIYTDDKLPICTYQFIFSTYLYKLLIYCIIIYVLKVDSYV